MFNKKSFFKKIAVGAAILVFIYLLALVTTGWYVNHHKDRIRAYVSEIFHDNLAGEATVKDIDISVWKKFPYIDFTVVDFSLKDSLYHEPVISVGAISTSFNIFQVIFAGKTVKNIAIENGLLHLFTDSTGYNNNYLLTIKKKILVNPSASSGPGEINIDHLFIANLDIIIEDKQKQKEISMQVEELKGSISQSGQLVAIDMQEKIAMKKGLGFNLRKGAYLEGERIEAKWKLQYDISSHTLSFPKTTIHIDDRPFIINGQFVLGKVEPSFAIHVEASKVQYTAIKSIVTAAIREKLNRYDVADGLDVKATIIGSLLPAHEPTVDLQCNAANNKVHTNFADITNCSFSGSFTNHDNKDSAANDRNSTIRFADFKADWQGIPVTAKNIIISQLDSPRLNVQVHADAGMQEIDRMLALKEMAFEQGNAIFDLSYNGPMPNGEPLVEKIQGTVIIKDASVNYVPRNFLFTNCNGTVNLYPDSISMRGFTCLFRNNKFTVNIDGSNMRGRLMGTDTARRAVITCSVNSPSVVLDDFTALFGDKKQRGKTVSPEKQFAHLSNSMDNFIGNSIIDISMKAGSIRNQHLEAKNFDTRIRFEPNRWVLSRIAMNVAGGAVLAKGNVEAAGNGNHRTTITVTVDNADVKKLLYAFDNFGQDAVTHENLRGNFITQANLLLDISAAGHVVPASLHGNVMFSLRNGALENFSPFDHLKTFVFKKRNLDNVKFAEIKDRFDIDESGIYINRMEVQSTAFRLFIEGNYGLAKKNTDLLIQVPFSNLNDNSFSPDSTLKNQGVGNRKLGNIWLRAVNDDDGKIKVKLTLNRKVLQKKEGE